MFLPVACLQCGKLFQVPHAAAGTDVACPWCKATTPALPVAGVPTVPVEEPLSLDDAPALPKRRLKAEPVARSSIPTEWILNAAIGLVLAVVVLGITLAVLRYGSGHISPIAWSEFTPPDGSCTISLPGSPTLESLDPSPADTTTRGLQKYSTHGWYSGTKVWFGWRDLDPAWVKQAAMDRDGAITSPVLAAERDLRKAQVGGTIAKEATVRFGQNLGLEVQMDTPKGKLIERYIVATDGPRPRLYFMGIEAKNATADSAYAQKLFNSFRVNQQ